ncbi:hypothetical protein D3C78_1756560 [compost metagenome]
MQGFAPPFGLADALVAAPCPAVRRWRAVWSVLAGQNTSRQRAVRHNTQTVVMGGRQMLDLNAAVDQVIQRLAGHRPVQAHIVGQTHHFGNVPTAEV